MYGRKTFRSVKLFHEHMLKTCHNAPVNVNHGPPDPRDIAGDVTFLQCYILTFTPALGGIWTVTIPALRALPSRGVWGHAPPENFEILYSQRRIFLHSEALNGKYETC